MSQRTSDTPDRGQVIRFRPRRGAPAWRWPLAGLRPGQDREQGFPKFDPPETDADYRHRMKMNVLGLVVTVVLMGVGAWLATTLADIQKNQDCYLAGRRDCTPMPGPSALRR